MLFKIVTLYLGLTSTVSGLVVRAVGPAAVNLGTAGSYTIIGKAGISTVPSSHISM